MSDVTTTLEVWDGMGEMRLSTTDSNAAYQLKNELLDADVYAHIVRISSWKCQNCPRTVQSQGGRDTECDCGAQYNGFGQRLRDRWRDNSSNNNDDIGDLEGYEASLNDW
jgi:hypothetical protein